MSDRAARLAAKRKRLAELKQARGASAEPADDKDATATDQDAAGLTTATSSVTASAAKEHTAATTHSRDKSSTNAPANSDGNDGDKRVSDSASTETSRSSSTARERSGLDSLGRADSGSVTGDSADKEEAHNTSRDRSGSVNKGQRDTSATQSSPKVKARVSVRDLARTTAQLKKARSDIARLEALEKEHTQSISSLRSQLVRKSKQLEELDPDNDTSGGSRMEATESPSGETSTVDGGGTNARVTALEAQLAETSAEADLMRSQLEQLQDMLVGEMQEHGSAMPEISLEMLLQRHQQQEEQVGEAGYPVKENLNVPFAKPVPYIKWVPSHPHFIPKTKSMVLCTALHSEISLRKANFWVL